jgi:hypothetical protein
MARDRLHLRRLGGCTSHARERLERREDYGPQKRGSDLRPGCGLRCLVPAPAERALKQGGDDPPPPSPRARATPPAARARASAHRLAQGTALRASVSA